MLQRAGQYSSCAVMVAFKGHMHDSWLWSAGMARVGSSKHSPGRRITFPSILPLFTPPSQPRSAPLEPVKEGEQLSTKPVLPSKNRLRPNLLFVPHLRSVYWPLWQE